MLLVLKTVALFSATAAAEIFGCYAAYLWLRLGRSPMWLIPGAVSLAAFAWLLTLHPTSGAGRTYAAYGGVYVAVSILWLWFVEKIQPDRWDILGSVLCMIGMFIVFFGPRS